MSHVPFSAGEVGRGWGKSGHKAHRLASQWGTPPVDVVSPCHVINWCKMCIFDTCTLSIEYHPVYLQKSYQEVLDISTGVILNVSHKVTFVHWRVNKWVSL